jgi:acyl carrier protein
MPPPSPSSSTNPSDAASKEEAIQHLPPPILAAFRKFETDGDVAALDPVIMAILEDFIPRQPGRKLAELPGDTRLMKDLGLDSLAIAQVVFFTEDLFGVNITNEEIIQVRTLDDLRSFVRRKVTARAAG